MQHAHARELPIADMAREEDARLSVFAQAIDVFGIDDLHAAFRRIEPKRVEMGIFSEDAAMVIPHGAQNALDLRLRLFGEGAVEIGESAARNPKARAEMAA